MRGFCLFWGLWSAKIKGIAQRKTKTLHRNPPVSSGVASSSTEREATAEEALSWQETSIEEKIQVRLARRRRHQTRKEHGKLHVGVKGATR